MTDTAKNIIDQYNELPDNLKPLALDYIAQLVEQNQQAEQREGSHYDTYAPQPIMGHRRTRGEILTGIVPGEWFTWLRTTTAKAIDAVPKEFTKPHIVEACPDYGKQSSVQTLFDATDKMIAILIYCFHHWPDWSDRDILGLAYLIAHSRSTKLRER